MWSGDVMGELLPAPGFGTVNCVIPELHPSGPALSVLPPCSTPTHGGPGPASELVRPRGTIGLVRGSTSTTLGKSGRGPENVGLFKRAVGEVNNNNFTPF
jgi:hypothetical protein